MLHVGICRQQATFPVASAIGMPIHNLAALGFLTLYADYKLTIAFLLPSSCAVIAYGVGATSACVGRREARIRRGHSEARGRRRRPASQPAGVWSLRAHACPSAGCYRCRCWSLPCGLTLGCVVCTCAPGWTCVAGEQGRGPGLAGAPGNVWLRVGAQCSVGAGARARAEQGRSTAAVVRPRRVLWLAAPLGRSCAPCWLRGVGYVVSAGL